MNPFIAIWTKPQQTVQNMIERKSIGFGILAIVLGALSSGVFTFADTGFLYNFSLPIILFIALFLTIVISVSFYFLNVLMYLWIGKWLGGKGKWKEMCLATACGSLPMVGMLPVAIAAILIYGKTLFAEPIGPFAITNMSAGFYGFYSIIMLGLSIFGIVILSKAIGYAHQFSALRGFGVVMIYAGIVFAIVFFIMIMLLGSFVFLGM